MKEIYSFTFHSIRSILFLSGGYGGRGGSPANNFLSPGDAKPYGSFVEPHDPGSAGGSANGGYGGGAIRLDVETTIDINGILSTNGGDGTRSGGGGSGGSVYVNASKIRGYGTISARGGNGASDGGGGGGGRITLKHEFNEFDGEIVADGGLGGILDTFHFYSNKHNIVAWHKFINSIMLIYIMYMFIWKNAVS